MLKVTIPQYTEATGEIVSYPHSATVSVDIIALDNAVSYLRKQYSSTIRIETITSSEDGSVRLTGTAYHVPVQIKDPDTGQPARGITVEPELYVSVWANAKGEVVDQ